MDDRQFLEGRVAIVTGGSRGIGYAIAEQILAHGGRALVTGTDEAHLASAVVRLGAPGRVEALRADVRVPADVERMVERAAAAFGGIDILVNNAGVGRFVHAADMTLAQWHEVIDTNLNGVFYCCHAVIPHLRTRGGGWIVNVSSLAGKNAFVGGSAYCASKSGLNAFSEALMQEVRHDGIRVSYVMPGSVATEFGGAPGEEPWKLTAGDVAQVVIDLLAHDRRSLPSRVEIRPSRPPRKG
jgi:NAD(P)-dependent dehydrogenase (short-subunit alcohol dehydrogenase family)